MREALDWISLLCCVGVSVCTGWQDTDLYSLTHLIAHWQYIHPGAYKLCIFARNSTKSIRPGVSVGTTRQSWMHAQNRPIPKHRLLLLNLRWGIIITLAVTVLHYKHRENRITYTHWITSGSAPSKLCIPQEGLHHLEAHTPPKSRCCETVLVLSQRQHLEEPLYYTTTTMTVFVLMVLWWKK